MFAWLIGAINSLIIMLSKVVGLALSFLPDSPFTKYINAQNPVLEYLGFINYFVPFTTCIEIATAWTVAIGFVYVIQVVLRWAKLME